MPIRKTGNKYYWGSKGPFDSRKKAEEVASAAHASGYEGSIDLSKSGMNDPNWTPDDEVGLQYSERQSRKDKAMSLPNYEALRTHQAFSREGERDNTYPSAVGDYARESIPNFPIGTKETRPLHPYNIGYDPKTLRQDKAYREAKVRNLQNAVLKLMKFITIQKIGYTTQPGSRFDEEDKFIPFAQQGRSQELTPAWEGGSEAVKKVGRDIGNQSFGLPALGSKAHQNILDTVSKTKDVSFAPSNSGLKSSEHISHTPGSTPAWLAHTAFDPLSEAHVYLNSIKNQRQSDSSGTRHNYDEVDMHMAGHRALATVQNIMQFGEDYLDHPNAIRYLKHERNTNWNARDDEAAWREGREYEEPYYLSEVPMSGRYDEGGIDGTPLDYDAEMTIPLEEYHKQLLHGHLDPDMSNEGKGMADELHKKLRMESPAYNPEAEEAYPLSQFPASLHTAGSSLKPSKYVETVQEGTPEGQQTLPDGPYNYPSHERRREWYGDSSKKLSSFKPGSAMGQAVANIKDPSVFERHYPHLYKEGDGGGAFNGLSGTVFTSSHAGIFTPTFGERGTRRRHRKNKRNQDDKRKKLMGEDKKNGLDRLVQFLQEGSPRLSKRQPDKMMTGQFQSIHVDRQTPRKQIDWRKKRVNKELEKTTEEINWKKRQEGISEDKDYPNMSADTSSLATSSTYPGDSEGTWTGTKPVPAKTDWGMRKTTVQKAEIPKVFGGTNVSEESHETFPDPKETHKLEQEPNIQNDIEKAGTGGLTGIGPLTNQNTRAATGLHPQDTHVEKTPAKELRQQVIDQNDFDQRVKSYDSKEDEKGNIDQPRAAGATKSMMDYPNSNMQMMEKSGWGSGIDIHQDDLHRGGELDEEDVDIEDDKEDDSHDWIPEDENEVKAEKEWLDKFQLLHKSFVRGSNATPVLSAILALDNE